MEKPSQIGIAILAAGASLRMGAPKLLLEYAGTTLLEQAILKAQQSLADEIVVVSGAYRKEMLPILSRYSVSEAFNTEWTSGQSSSVKTAVYAALTHSYDALIVCIADQPNLKPSHIDKLIEAYSKKTADAYVSQVGSRWGNPCLFDHDCFARLLTLEGDQGARSLLNDSSVFTIEKVEFGDEDLFWDIDTPTDFKKLEERFLWTTV